MSFSENEFESRFGQLLYEVLPAVYRERDNTERDPVTRTVSSLGDLARYLDGLGLLLDRVRATLDQRLADAFPGNPGAGRACQEWLIPYFARLLDVRLVSPDLNGQRDEVFHAVRWRQAKGTLLAVEEISQAVTRQEVELQEGWRRVALTARVGWPLLPPAVHGVQLALDPRWPSRVTKHPGLPAVTIDLRCPSQAVSTTVVSPAVKTSRLGGVSHRWMQSNPHGVPAGPGSFDDVSRRTADLRTPTFAQGHSHPRRLLAYTTVPFGRFPPPPVTMTWSQAATSPLVAWILDRDRRELTVRNISDRPVIISDAVQLPAGLEVDRVTIEKVRFAGKLTMSAGRLSLHKVVATEVAVQTNLIVRETPILTATDCLLGTVGALNGYARFERCTIRRKLTCNSLLADDCVFAGDVAVGPNEAGLVRHSCVPPLLESEANPEPFIVDPSCTRETPKFFASSADDVNGAIAPEAGVLTPDCPAQILFGARDGGEMGAYHDGRDWPVVLTRDQELDLAQDRPYPLRDLVFAGRVDIKAGVQQPLRLERVAAADLRIHAAPRSTPEGRPQPVLEATSALFDALTVDRGLARLEACTVLGAASFGPVQASDCLFAGTLTGGAADGGLRREDCVRFSRVPPQLLAGASSGGGLALTTCTAERPVFFEPRFAAAVAGSSGGGVLHPATPAEICSGAEDGGELGAYHEDRHCLGRQALLDKLAEHLPVGIEPVLIPDRRLHLMPPAARTERNNQP